MVPIISSLVLADSLQLLKAWYDNGVVPFIDLGYNDPPFNSNRHYNLLYDSKTNTSEEAFNDTWSSVKYFDLLHDFKKYDPEFHNFLVYYLPILPNDSFRSYLSIMGIFYWFEHKMLKDTGSLYHHCDPTTSHYIKPILDKIFGYNNFRNEIVWCYGKWTNVSKNFQKNHDIIFFYSKTNDYSFNRLFDTENIRGHHEKGYHTNTIHENGRMISQILIYDETKVTDGLLKKYDKVVYRLEQKAVVFADWWNISIINSQAKERLGYPTQKPEKLLERIILASSNEKDVVADFFNGGGTTVTTAAKLNRKFIGVDINYRAIQMTVERLAKIQKYPKRHYIVDGIPRSSVELRMLVDENIYGMDKNSKFALQDVATKFYLKNVIPSKKKSGDGSVDGEFYFNYNKIDMRGIVQITSTASVNHLKAFGSEIAKGNADMGVYVTFQNTVSKGMLKEAKSYGKIGNVDKFQILTFEELIDNGKQFDVPQDLLTV